MTATFQPNIPVPGQTTLNFTYSKDTLIMQKAGNHIAEWLYNRLTPAQQAALAPTFGQLTQLQKLALMDDGVIEILRAWNEGNIRQHEEADFQSQIDTIYANEGL